jgi:hypothetical protein
MVVEIEIKGNAGILHSELSSIVLNASGTKGPLMDTLILRVEKDKMYSKMATEGEVVVVVYETNQFDTTGVGQITISASDLLRRIKLFPTNEIITISIKDQDVMIKGKTRRAKLRLTDTKYAKWYEKDLKTDKGMIVFRNGQKPTTQVKVKGSELNTIPEIEGEVGLGIYNFVFSSKGSHGYVGDLADPSTKPIRQEIIAVVEGEDAKVSFSSGARELLSILSNEEWLIGAQTNAPMFFYQKTAKRSIMYLIAPMVGNTNAEE